MSGAKGKLIVALDVETWDEAKILVNSLSGEVDIFKIGSQLFTACGPEAVRYILKKKKKVFLDLKFYDIPNTVAGAVKAAVGITEGKEGIFMCTLHTLGGEAMLRAAVEAAAQQAQDIGVQRPLLVGITVLTSEEKKDSIHHLVLERAALARDAGLDGVVASSQEAAVIRREFGEDFIIVTPGIRSQGADTQDQRRVTTPSDAIRNGSHFLVVGRPIIKAKDPLASARSILEEIKRA
jgi:orotidine-5'-phosphate decarboxylase